VTQQPSGSASVFCGHDWYGTEHFRGTARQITQIPQRGGDDIEGARGHIVGDG
jgi:hypothetical protein